MSFIFYPAPLSWVPPKNTVNLRKTYSGKISLDPASRLDVMPYEILEKILHHLEVVDIFVLSLTSRNWLRKAWNFTTTLELRPFYVVSSCLAPFGVISESQSWPLESSTTPHLRGMAVDITKLPRPPNPKPAAERTLSKSGPYPKPDFASTDESATNDTPKRAPRLGNTKKASNSAGTLRCSSVSTRLVISPPEASFSGAASTPVSPPTRAGSRLSKSAHLPDDSLSRTSPERATRARSHSSSPQPTWNVCHFLQLLLPRFPPGQLLELSFAGCAVYERVFKKIAATECRNQLKALNLENCIGLSSGCMRYISKLVGLQYLNLHGCDGIGQSSLKYLRTMTNLMYLDMKDVLCVKRVLSASSMAPISTPIGHPPSYGACRSSAIIGAMSSYQPTHQHPAQSFFADAISARVSFLSSDLDSSDDSEEEVDEVLAVGHRVDIPLEWYTPAHDIIDAVSRLTRLVVLNLSEWNKNIAKSENTSLLARLTDLRSLQLQHGGCMNDLARLPRLESLSFATSTYANYYVLGSHFIGVSMPGLRSLNFSNCYRINDAALTHVVDCAPNLVELRISSCDCITDLSLIETLPKLHASLQYLDLRHIDSVTDRGLAHLTKLTNLHVLNLRRINGLQSCSPFASMTKLQSLDISYCPKVTNDSISQLAPCALKVLVLRGLTLLGLTALRPLFTEKCSLLSVDLQECPAFTHAMSAAKSAWKDLRNSLPANLQECLISSKQIR